MELCILFCVQQPQAVQFREVHRAVHVAVYQIKVHAARASAAVCTARPHGAHREAVPEASLGGFGRWVGRRARVQLDRLARGSRRSLGPQGVLPPTAATTELNEGTTRSRKPAKL